MLTKKIIAVVACALAGSLVFVATPAMADTLPADGKIFTGQSEWRLDTYGLASGSDTAGHYSDVASGSMYYPMEFYVQGTPSNNYIFCGGSLFEYVNTVITAESNGDKTVTCPSYEIDPTSHLQGQLIFHIYATENNGWLIRQEAILTNPTGTDISMTNFVSFGNIGEHTYGDASDSTALTSSGSTTVPSDADSWILSSYNDGASVTSTIAWALTGSASSENILTDAVATNTYGPRTVLANSALHFVQFTNMNIPASPFDSSVAALASATAQVSEFDSFSGRLIEGLDPSTYYIGWGLPCTPPIESALEAEPVLATTGVNETNVLLLTAGGVLALLVGATATMKARRRRAVK